MGAALIAHGPSDACTARRIDGVIAGALTGRLIAVPYERGDSADLAEVFARLLDLEAVAAGSSYLKLSSPLQTATPLSLEAVAVRAGRPSDTSQ